MASQDDYIKGLQSKLGSLDLEMFKPFSTGTKRGSLESLSDAERVQMLLDYIANLQGLPGVDPQEAMRAQEILGSEDPMQAIQGNREFADQLFSDYTEDDLQRAMRAEAQASGAPIMGEGEAAQLSDQARIDAYWNAIRDSHRIVIPRAKRSGVLGE
jgi:hypothetical protein